MLSYEYKTFNYKRPNIWNIRKSSIGKLYKCVQVSNQITIATKLRCHRQAGLQVTNQLWWVVFKANSTDSQLIFSHLIQFNFDIWKVRRGGGVKRTRTWMQLRGESKIKIWGTDGHTKTDEFSEKFQMRGWFFFNQNIHIADFVPLNRFFLAWIWN